MVWSEEGDQGCSKKVQVGGLLVPEESLKSFSGGKKELVTKESNINNNNKYYLYQENKI